MKVSFLPQSLFWIQTEPSSHPLISLGIGFDPCFIFFGGLYQMSLQYRFSLPQKKCYHLLSHANPLWWRETVPCLCLLPIQHLQHTSHPDTQRVSRWCKRLDTLLLGFWWQCGSMNTQHQFYTCYSDLQFLEGLSTQPHSASTSVLSSSTIINISPHSTVKYFLTLSGSPVA